MTAPLRSNLRKALEGFALGAVVLLLLELTARVFLFGWAGLVPARIDSVHALPQTGFTRASAEPRLSFELRPNLDGWFKLARFRTNAAGLRDRDYARPKPENTFRVAVVGSSFALPAGVAIEEAFHSRLETRFAASLSPLRVEFVNFAVGMYHPKQTLATLELRALDYEPDLALFTLTELSTPPMLEDPDAQRLGDVDLSGIPRFERTHPILQSFLWRLYVHRTRGADEAPRAPVGVLERAYLDLSARLSSADPAPAATAPPHRPAPGARGGPLIDRLARLARERALPVVLVRLAFEEVPPDASDRAVARRAAELGLHYVDTRDAFAGTDPRDFWIYEIDPHPDGRAHGIFADVIGRFLVERDLVPRPQTP